MRASYDYAYLDQTRYVTDTIINSRLVKEGLNHPTLFGGQREDYNLDWKGLTDLITTGGCANSLFCCNMPTASTSNLYGYTESFEPLNEIVSVRKTISGEKVAVNRLFVEELEKIGLWNQQTLQDIIVNGGIQNIAYIPSNIKNIFKTRWDIKMKPYLEMCAERQTFVDQSQSMNLFYKDNEFAPVYSSLMYAWKLGLKTLSYYSWFKPKSEGNKSLAFKVDNSQIENQISCIGCQ